jgi:hypothetical protein
LALPCFFLLKAISPHFPSASFQLTPPNMLPPLVAGWRTSNFVDGGITMRILLSGHGTGHCNMSIPHVTWPRMLIMYFHIWEFKNWFSI